MYNLTVTTNPSPILTYKDLNYTPRSNYRRQYSHNNLVLYQLVTDYLINAVWQHDQLHGLKGCDITHNTAYSMEPKLQQMRNAHMAHGT